MRAVFPLVRAARVFDDGVASLYEEGIATQCEAWMLAVVDEEFYKRRNSSPMKAYHIISKHSPAATRLRRTGMLWFVTGFGFEQPFRHPSKHEARLFRHFSEG